MNARKWLIRAAMVLGLLTAGAGSASANSFGSYVCAVNYNPGSSTFGSYGYVLINVTSGPDCTGTLTFVGYLCSAGATNSGCTNDSLALYSYWNMPQMAIELMEASQWNYYMGVQDGNCINGGTTCFHFLSFYG